MDGKKWNEDDRKAGGRFEGEPLALGRDGIHDEYMIEEHQCSNLYNIKSYEYKRGRQKSFLHEITEP
jgi:hypothetical protein